MIYSSITLLEDDKYVIELIKYVVEDSGYELRIFNTISELDRSLDSLETDLFVIDLLLPDGNGFEICKKIRELESLRDIPIIILSGLNEERERVMALESCADDYVTKPFSPREFLARVRAIIRRRQQDSEKMLTERIGPILIEYDKQSVFVNGSRIDLTSSEYKILRLLIRNQGSVFSRETILKHLWGYDKAVTSRTIDVHITHLRDKLGDAGEMIKNVRGTGYKIETLS
jgi:DNA-binding response OmpR family regulator